MQETNIEWTRFLGRAVGSINPEIVARSLEGKRILITGAGGYIGSALARYLGNVRLQQLVFLDIAEQGLFELDAELDDQGCSVQRISIVGDVCDAALLHEIFTEHRPQVVFHAAACKHVPLMETNPFTAARNNILGTRCLLEAANQMNSEQVIVISTDKAVNPIGIMGATKRVGELLVLADSGPAQVKAVRLANVLESTGSVGPIFLRQIARGGPITITDPACTRYFLSIDEVVQQLISALAVDAASAVLVSDAGEPVPIVDLAQFLVQHTAPIQTKMDIQYIGLRPGDKLTEFMMAQDESLIATNIAFLQKVFSLNSLPTPTIHAAIEEIEAAIQARHLRQLVDGITRLIPAYLPSKQLQQLIDTRKSEITA